MFPRLFKSSAREPLMSPMISANSGNTAVYTCDSAGVITYYNARAAELWGCKPAAGDSDERFCGSLMLYRVDGSYLPHDRSPMAGVLAASISGVFDGEVHVQRPDGTRIVAIVNIAPLVDDNGVVVGGVCSFCENPYRKPVDHARVQRHS